MYDSLAYPLYIDQLFSMADFYSCFGLLVDRKLWIIVVLGAAVPLFSCLSALCFLRKEPSK